MAVRALLALLGLFHLANGLWMLTAPESWYAAIPGVTQTGPLNHHFIADIAMAFIGSGAGLALGARAGLRAAMLAVAGATWPALHALVHIWGWLMHGFPTAPAIAVSEAAGVVGLAALGVALAWLRIKGES
jgi:hypothetical protein